MATYPVRFEFHCDNETLEFIHNIPRHLITADAQASREDAGYIDQFARSLRPIIKEHEPACRAASNPLCIICGSLMVTVLQTPMSWLHKVEDPFVVVLISGICGKGECEIKMRQEVQETMGELVTMGQSHRPSESGGGKEVLPCRICGKTEGTMRCGRCKVVAYCGKEHQKRDWNTHKRACVSKEG
ncbi:hypothetical protein P152DRAFT_47717 [Eremomyces bilateralis CBS 781.70]|uniref:MYND-type domain-containing protein n=1 Tax=Eremomyces bilateralis CBS 781.70 TaxID=1392243 RepID=A0A6G1G147_9PEZI|nr:uncharacterized protein P152DRAFT_47717 [Eremomyces bilateralis CBS 781.70]KAF1811650.1 hypothetical protein P152DRAFT_47717 [Eremomyces bilateralis CBS 781.70]